MTTTEFVTHLQGVKDTAKGHLAHCPAHTDRHQSFLVTEAADRILVHCRAGCRTSDVLSAMGLDYADLFFDNGKAKGTTHPSGPRQPERVPRWDWNWRSQCAEVERAIQGKREYQEAILQATHGLDVNSLTVDEFDELCSYVGEAYSWLAQYEQLDETLFDLQQTLRAEERTQRVKG